MLRRSDPSENNIPLAVRKIGLAGKAACSIGGVMLIDNGRKRMTERALARTRRRKVDSKCNRTVHSIFTLRDAKGLWGDGCEREELYYFPRSVSSLCIVDTTAGAINVD